MTSEHFWTSKRFVVTTLILALIVPLVIFATIRHNDRRLPEQQGSSQVIAPTNHDPIVYPTYYSIVVEDRVKAPTPKPRPKPVVKKQTPPRVSSYVGQPSEKTRLCIVHAESRGIATVRRNDGGSASGLYGFIDKTWNRFKGYSSAWKAPASVQTQRFFNSWKYWQNRWHSELKRNPWYGDRRCWT